MPPHEFRNLADQLQTAQGCIRLAQFSPQWAADEHAIELRDRIDDALLQRLLLCPKAVDVQRIVLYDLPGRWRAGTPGKRHTEWVKRLRRDLTYLGAGRAGSPVNYEIRQLVLAAEGPKSRPPDEIAAMAGHPPFKKLWKTEGLFPVTPTEAVAKGQYGDQDPLFHLDLNVGDADRLQIGPEQRRRRHFARGEEPDF